jgi:periplasmic protein TonB
MIGHLEFLEGSGARARRWLIAAAMMVSMHAAAGALAVMNWPEEESSDEEAGSFMVELAPVPVAPPTEKLNLAIGPRAEEAAAAVAPTEEVKEKSEVETPKVEEAPLAPQPEVVVEKQKPVEEIEDKKEEEDPRPEQKALPQASVASQETSAPPPVDAPPAEKPAAPKQGVSSKPSEATMSWQKSLVFHLNKHKKYPHEARKNGHEGVASVSFTLDRSGKVISSHLDKSSGSDLLDEEAIEVLNRASPFPTPPSDVPNLTINLSLPIQFRIKR